MKRPSLSTARRPVVLLVQPSRDDSLEMYAESLRYHGLAVIPVSAAGDTLMLASQADIVVTGINLDDPMDGVELASRLRHDDCTRSTPIVVLTACAWAKDRERAVGAGCDVFLPKPCLPNDLLGEVRQFHRHGAEGSVAAGPLGRTATAQETQTLDWHVAALSRTGGSVTKES